MRNVTKVLSLALAIGMLPTTAVMASGDTSAASEPISHGAVRSFVSEEGCCPLENASLSVLQAHVLPGMDLVELDLGVSNAGEYKVSHAGRAFRFNPRTGNFISVIRSGVSISDLNIEAPEKVSAGVEGKLSVLNASVLPGMDLVEVSLDVANANQYRVSHDGRAFRFNPRTGNFISVVRAGTSFSDLNIQAPEKTIEVRGDIAITNPQVLPGMNAVEVTLNVEDPENYNVAAEGRNFRFNPRTGKFISVISQARTSADLVITPIATN